MKNSHNDSKLAARWACDERTIRRWRKDRAPLSDSAKMRTWLAGRKNIPPGTAALLEQTRTAQSAEAASNDTGVKEGAAHALKRLEAAEAKAYGAFTRATASGDAVSIKTSRENWLKISESLRRFDLALELSRRDTGELVPRGSAESAAYAFAANLQSSIRWQFEVLAPRMVSIRTPEEIWNLVGPAIDGAISNSLSLITFKGIPDWLVSAINKSMAAHVPILNIAEIVDAKERMLQQCYKEFCQASISTPQPTGADQ